jgi:hypothetical protein
MRWCLGLSRSCPQLRIRPITNLHRNFDAKDADVTPTARRYGVLAKISWFLANYDTSTTPSVPRLRGQSLALPAPPNFGPQGTRAAGLVPL